MGNSINKEPLKEAYRSISFKKDKIAWYITALIIGALVFGGKYIWNPEHIILPNFQQNGTNYPQIIILQYDKVSKNSNSSGIQLNHFKNQLQALKEDGFEAIRMEDLRNFYYQGTPLPQKSLLLIFGIAYLETYELANPILTSLKWPATVSTDIEKLQAQDTNFLYWNRLQRMVNGGLWEIALSGHQFLDLNSEEKPYSKNNLSLNQLIWREGEKRLETNEEYRNRIVDYYKTGKTVIEDNIKNYKVIAYLPLIDNLKNTFKDPILYIDNLLALNSFFQLSFADSFVGLNNKWSNPLNLKRLRVSPEWNAEDLLKNISQSLKVLNASDSKKPIATSVMFTPDGIPVNTLNSLKLMGEGVVPQVNSHLIQEAWIPVEEWLDNWSLEARIRIESGEIWVIQKSFENKNQFRFGITDKGFTLQFKRGEELFQSLAYSQKTLEDNEWYHLSIIRRGMGVWVELDGEPVWERPIYLPDTFSGDVGIASWSQSGDHSAELKDMFFSSFPSKIRMLSNKPTVDEVQDTKSNFKEISFISTPTYVIKDSKTHLNSFDGELFSILTRRYGWGLIPTVQVFPNSSHHIKGAKSEDTESRDFWFKEILELVEKFGWEKIHVVFDRIKSTETLEGLPLILDLKTRLLKHNCQLFISWSESLDTNNLINFSFSEQGIWNRKQS